MRLVITKVFTNFLKYCLISDKITLYNPEILLKVQDFKSGEFHQIV